MDLRQLTTYRVLARTLNFHQAAEQLHCVQSTVTAQIQALEDELGARLFDRLGRRVVLTDAGTRLVVYADRLLNLADEARLAVSGQKDQAGTLTISATETLCTYRLPAVLHRFRRRFPRVRLIFFALAYSELRQAVAEGVVDVAFVMEEPIIGAALHAEPLCAEPIHLVVSPDHPLARRRGILPVDLEAETILVTEPGCSYRVQFQHRLNTAGVQPASVLEFNSIEAIKQCAMVGMGIGVLPAVATNAETAHRKLLVLPWRGKPIRMITQAIRHKQKWVSPALQAFLSVVKEGLLTPAGKDPAIQPSKRR
ncbi:MAG: LysR family transcriptional regulator [Verrucomicrobia bacterium]|nr:LysR family transcriptional regulator [Verrucomicrobiota bacterium]